MDGRQIDVASSSLDNLESSGYKAGDGARQAEDGVKGAGDESAKADGKVRKFVSALGLVAISAAAFQVLRASMDDAITRFDTLAQFPKVLEGLGASAEDSEQAMTKLADGIDGLPTKLDDITNTTQRLYTVFDDADKAADSALALNNALLSSSASTEDARRGTEQYIQALQTGQIDMRQWRTLQETMNVGLVKVAEAFGYAGSSATNDLYAALQSGQITMTEFNDKLIEVGTGTGELAGLARENSLGIATSFGNLRYAVARGIAVVIESFDNLSQEVTGNTIAENIDSMKEIVMASFTAIGNIIERTTPFVKAFASVVGTTIDVVRPLTPVIIGATSAYAGLLIVKTVGTAMASFRTVVMGVTVVQKAATVATTASAVAYNTMTGRIVAARAAQIAFATATKGLRAAMLALAGPVGWVTIGIGALVGAVVGVVKWFNRASEEGERLNAQTEELDEATNTLSDSINQSSEAYEQNQRDIQATSEANQDLANRIEDLADKENKSAAEKQMLASYIDQLNESVEGLNLSYNEEADALNMSSEELRDRVDLMEEQTSYNAALERQMEISKEQHEVDQQLKETNALREEWNQKLEEGSVKSREHKQAIEELDEQEQELRVTKAELAEQQEETEAQLTESMEAITEATENGVTNQKIAFEDLSESQQETVESMKSTWEDYKDAATDMFDTLSDEAELTVDEMTENLEENQRIIGEWAEGIATLAERGVDEGLLDTLREAGPESAGHVNALVNASDEELEGLSDAFAKGGETATDALSKSLGIEESGVMDAVGHLVTDTEEALSQQVKSAGFESIGDDVAGGLADGIDQGTPQAEQASKNMADDTTSAAENALGVRSPSTVFREIGTNVTEGLVLGINQGTEKVIQAVQRMFDSFIRTTDNSFNTITRNHDRAIQNIERSMNKLPPIVQRSMQNMLSRLRSGASSQVSRMRSLARDLISPFNRTQSQFNSIGRNAMSGLNAGLNAGRGRVMSTARSIANSVANTMRSALRIQSPSRLMRDDVGKWIPEGVALGIEENAKSVYKALDNLSSGMMRMATPEMALGTSRMAYAGATNQVTNIYNTNTTNQPSGGQSMRVEAGDVYIDGYLAGKVLWRPVKENIDRDDRINRQFRG